MSREIKNIIFDLGGVLLNIDYALTIKAFESHGVSNFEEVYSQAKQTDLFDKFETGKITENEFIEGIKSLIRKDIQKNQILEAWNAMLLDFPKERLSLLQEASKHYRIFLLSNTNETHITAFEKIIEEPSLFHAGERPALTSFAVPPFAGTSRIASGFPSKIIHLPLGL